MNILFVCKHNRFRSQVAENYFRKINKNKNIKSYSAGLFIGSDIAKTTKKVGRKLGIRISGRPKGISEKLLKKIDLIVIVANDIPEQLFEGKAKKIMVWKIRDTMQSDFAGVEEISKQIMEKVDELNRTLGAKNEK